MSIHILSVVGRSHIGLVRTANEDGLVVASSTLAAPCFACTSTISIDASPRAAMIAVADGCGGNRGGDVASHEALRLLVSRWSSESGLRPDVDELAHAIHTVNGSLFASLSGDDSHAGAATTLTVAVTDGASMVFGQVGDSRGYILRDGRLQQTTVDQTLMELLVREGHITQAETRIHTHSTVVLQALGSLDRVDVGLSRLRLLERDRILLCTDGLWRRVEDVSIEEILASVQDLDQAADRLLEVALLAGGFDNVTLVLVDVVRGATKASADLGDASDVEFIAHGLPNTPSN